MQEGMKEQVRPSQAQDEMYTWKHVDSSSLSLYY